MPLDSDDACIAGCPHRTTTTQRWWNHGGNGGWQPCETSRNKTHADSKKNSERKGKVWDLIVQGRINDTWCWCKTFNAVKCYESWFLTAEQIGQKTFYTWYWLCYAASVSPCGWVAWSGGGGGGGRILWDCCSCTSSGVYQARPLSLNFHGLHEVHAYTQTPVDMYIYTPLFNNNYYVYTYTLYSTPWINLCKRTIPDRWCIRNHGNGMPT